MKKRLVAIDFIKVLGLIAMIQIHLAKYLLMNTEKGSFYFNFLNPFAYIAAPLFLTAVGINLFISNKNRGKSSFSHVLKRGLFLIAVGLLFINIWQGDILHYIGFFIILTSLIISFSTPIKILISSILIFGQLPLLKYINYDAGWEVLATKIANFWTLNGFTANLFANGFYPIFPWLAFPIIGTIIGFYLIKSIKKKQEMVFAFSTYIIGLLLMALGLILHLFIWKITFYPSSISYMIFFIGFTLFTFGLALYFLDMRYNFKKFNKLISFLGSVSLSLYLLHIIVGLGFFYLTSRLNTLSLTSTLLYIPLSLIIISLICYVSKLILGDGPLEYLMKKIVK